MHQRVALLAHLAAGVVHSMTTTSANVHETETAGCCTVGRDAGYQGVDKRPGNRGQVAMRPGQRRKLEPLRRFRSMSASERKVEHPFLYIKRHFGYAKVYRGLSKNTQRLMTLLGANL